MGAYKMKFLISLLLLFSTNVYAVSYGVYDLSELRYEHSLNTDEVRSIASITKLFTAMAVINSDVSLSEQIKVQGKSTGRFARGIYIERYELLRAMLMSSDNLSAESLAMAHPGGYDKFISDVNTMVSDLNLKNTVIVDSTGLLPGNKSTVDDLKDFLFTLRKYTLIQHLSTEKLYTYQYKKGKKTITIQLRNTNPQMWTYDNIVLTKTGFTNPAGRCLAMLVEKEDKLFAVVTLGNKDVRQRSQNITTMMNDIGIK
jgi:D-alanyl-D-alanine endopeptidase (penicillin-binding protein 7)